MADGITPISVTGATYSPAELVSMAWDRGLARSSEISKETKDYFDEALGLAGTAPYMSPAQFTFDASVLEPLVDIPSQAEAASVEQFEGWWDRIIDKLADLYAKYIDTYFPNDCAYLKHTQEWICKAITQGGSGARPEMERQIWQRDRDRVMQEYAAQVRDVISAFAARGFPMPAGMVMATIQKARSEAAAKVASSSRDQAIQQTQLEVETVRFAVEKAIALYGTAVDAARNYMMAFAGTSGNVTQLVPSITDSQSRLISAASDFYRSRVTARELQMRASLPNAEWQQQANAQNLQAQMSAANAKVQAAVEAARALAQQASALLNAMHVSSSTSASGGHSVSYNYSGEVTDDVPPHTV